MGEREGRRRRRRRNEEDEEKNAHDKRSKRERRHAGPSERRRRWRHRLRRLSSGVTALHGVFVLAKSLFEISEEEKEETF